MALDYLATPIIMYWILGRPKGLSLLSRIHTVAPSQKRPYTQIALIDDQAFAYLDVLRTHKFNITKFDDITDIFQVAEYKIVLCDIRGVGKAFGSHLEGGHLIEEIKKTYPWKVVIAYSSSEFDPSFNRAFLTAEFQLKKDIDSDQWVDYLDNAIARASDPKLIWKRIRSLLLEKDVDLSHVMALEDDYVSTVLAKHEWKPPANLLSPLPDDARAIINNLVSSAIFSMFWSS